MGQGQETSKTQGEKKPDRQRREANTGELWHDLKGGSLKDGWHDSCLQDLRVRAVTRGRGSGFVRAGPGQKFLNHKGDFNQVLGETPGCGKRCLRRWWVSHPGKS